MISKISQEVTDSANAPEAYSHEGFKYMYTLWKYWMTKEPDNTASLYTNNNGEANGFVELIKKVRTHYQ